MDLVRTASSSGVDALRTFVHAASGLSPANQRRVEQVAGSAYRLARQHGPAAMARWRSRRSSGRTAAGKFRRRSSYRMGGPSSTLAVIPRGFLRTAGYYGRFAAGKENKFFDTTLGFTIDITGEVPATGQLALIPQGVTESTRVGRKAFIKSIYIKVCLALLPAATANPSGVTEIYLCQDTQTNGAAAGVSDVFEGSVLSIAVRNLSNTTRFKILKKWKHLWNPHGAAAGDLTNQTKQITWFKKVNIPIEYSSTTGAISEICCNNIFLMAGAFQETTSSIDDLVNVTGVCRLRFTD